jgi:diguanylate cyclase (GGDEF)-like protein
VKRLVTVTTTTNTLLLLAFNALDGFTMLAIAALVVGWTQNLAYYSEANGPRATLLRTGIQTILYGGAYRFTTPHDQTLEPPAFLLVLLTILGLGLVMARVAKSNEERRGQIVELYRLQQRQTHELEVVNEKLRQLSMLDGLTGVANRRNFEEALARELGRMRRHREAMSNRSAARPQVGQLSLVLVDVDYFKAYNDRCGHLAGDDCLRQVATVLQSALLRPSDTLARYGGEEFAILLPETNQPGARVVADRALRALATEELPHPASPIAEHVTASAGLASANYQSEDEATSLVARADRALYRAKAEGRNRLVEDPQPPN